LSAELTNLKPSAKYRVRTKNPPEEFVGLFDDQSKTHVHFVVAENSGYSVLKRNVAECSEMPPTTDIFPPRKLPNRLELDGLARPSASPGSRRLRRGFGRAQAN
jgi:hypothetical protein